MSKKIVLVENVTTENYMKQGGRALTNVETDAEITGANKEKYYGKVLLTSTHIEYGENATKAKVWNDGEEPAEIDYPSRGWRETEPKYGIPNGKELPYSDEKARYLWRYSSKEYKGLVVRWSGFYDGVRDVVCVDGFYVGRFGVLVEIDVPEFKPCWKKPVEVAYREVAGESETIETREGTLKAYKDKDYIIRGIEGEEYPCKKEIFEKTYSVKKSTKKV